MYYQLYLSSLCQRRRWPDPHYEFTPVSSHSRHAYYSSAPPIGYTASVRVNHRIYSIKSVHETEELAREEAAMRAYFGCRDLSKAEQMEVAPPIVGSYHGSGGYSPTGIEGRGYYGSTGPDGWGARRGS